MSPGLAALPVAAPPPADEVGRWGVEPTLTAARSLRHEVLARWGDDAPSARAAMTMNRLVLVLTELVTNAVQHGERSIDVTLGRTARGWLIVVKERPPPKARSAAPLGSWWHSPDPTDGLGGRGLAIVVAVSARCGLQTRADELTVWAEVPVRR